MTELDEAMVEKVARALFECEEGRPVSKATLDYWFSCDENSTGEDANCKDQCDWLRGLARAALTAILPDLREQHYAECTAGIVAWQKDQWHRGELVCGDELAAAIERGDHITKEGE